MSRSSHLHSQHHQRHRPPAPPVPQSHDLAPTPFSPAHFSRSDKTAERYSRPPPSLDPPRPSTASPPAPSPAPSRHEVSKLFDPPSRGPVYSLTSPSSYLTLPKSRRAGAVVLTEPFLVVQVALPPSASPFHLHLQLMDNHGLPYSLTLSTVIAAPQLHAYHAKLPLEVERGDWVNLVLPVADLLHHCLRASYAGMVQVLISGCCKVRRVFPVPAAPPDDEGEGSGHRPLEMDSIPSEHNFDDDVIYHTRYIELPSVPTRPQLPPSRPTRHRKEKTRPEPSQLRRREEVQHGRSLQRCSRRYEDEVEERVEDEEEEEEEQRRREEEEEDNEEDREREPVDFGPSASAVRKSDRWSRPPAKSSSPLSADSFDEEEVVEKRGSIDRPAMASSTAYLVPYVKERAPASSSPPSRSPDRGERRREREQRRAADASTSSRRQHPPAVEAIASQFARVTHHSPSSRHHQQPQQPNRLYSTTTNFPPPTASSSSSARFKPQPELRRQLSAPEAADIQANRVGRDESDDTSYDRRHTRRGYTAEQSHDESHSRPAPRAFGPDLSSGSGSPVLSASSSAQSSRRQSRSSTHFGHASDQSSGPPSLLSTPQTSQPASPAIRSGTPSHPLSPLTSAPASRRESLQSASSRRGSARADVVSRGPRDDEEAEEEKRRQNSSRRPSDSTSSFSQPLSSHPPSSQADDVSRSGFPFRSHRPAETSSSLQQSTLSPFDGRRGQASLFNSPLTVGTWQSKEAPLPSALALLPGPPPRPFDFVAALTASSATASTILSPSSASHSSQPSAPTSLVSQPSASTQQSTLPASLATSLPDTAGASAWGQTSLREDARKARERPVRAQALQKETIEEADEEDSLHDDLRTDDAHQPLSDLKAEDDDPSAVTSAGSGAATPLTDSTSSRSVSWRGRGGVEGLLTASSSTPTFRQPSHRGQPSTESAVSSASSAGTPPLSMSTRLSAFGPASGNASSAAGAAAPTSTSESSSADGSSSRDGSSSSSRGELNVQYDRELKAYFEPATGKWYDMKV